MKAYYDTENGAVYCENCAPESIEPEAMAQETDCPEHCETCGAMLDYSLTSDGVQYVIDALIDAIRSGTATEVEKEWAADLRWYGLSKKHKAALDRFNTLFA